MPTPQPTHKQLGRLGARLLSETLGSTPTLQPRVLSQAQINAEEQTLLDMLREVARRNAIRATRGHEEVLDADIEQLFEATEKRAQRAVGGHEEVLDADIEQLFEATEKRAQRAVDNEENLEGIAPLFDTAEKTADQNNEKNRVLREASVTKAFKDLMTSPDYLKVAKARAERKAAAEDGHEVALEGVAPMFIRAERAMNKADAEVGHELALEGVAPLFARADKSFADAEQAAKDAAERAAFIKNVVEIALITVGTLAVAAAAVAFFAYAMPVLAAGLAVGGIVVAAAATASRVGLFSKTEATTVATPKADVVNADAEKAQPVKVEKAEVEAPVAAPVAAPVVK